MGGIHSALRTKTGESGVRLRRQWTCLLMSDGAGRRVRGWPAAGEVRTHLQKSSRSASVGVFFNESTLRAEPEPELDVECVNQKSISAAWTKKKRRKFSTVGGNADRDKSHDWAAGWDEAVHAVCLSLRDTRADPGRTEVRESERLSCN